jgi:drug/metabolite transporter (DMT)-like permease
VVVANPTGGVDDPDLGVWAVTGAGCLGVSAFLALLSRGRSAGVKATFLGSAAGILFALTAVLTKAVADQLGDGILDVFTHWHVYALVAVGWAGTTVSSAALQTGALAPAAATQMSLDPVASIALGVFAFDEQLHDTAFGAALALAGFAVMVVGLVVLSRSQSSAERNKVVPRPQGG